MACKSSSMTELASCGATNREGPCARTANFAPSQLALEAAHSSRALLGQHAIQRPGARIAAYSPRDACAAVADARSVWRDRTTNRGSADERLLPDACGSGPCRSGIRPGDWTTGWGPSRVGAHNLDPDFLMWDIHRELELAKALNSGAIALDGLPALCRDFPNWLALEFFTRSKSARPATAE